MLYLPPAPPQHHHPQNPPTAPFPIHPFSVLPWSARKASHEYMEFYQELLLSALISILLAFLIGKLAELSAADSDCATTETDSIDRARAIGEERVRSSSAADSDCTATETDSTNRATEIGEERVRSSSERSEKGEVNDYVEVCQDSVDSAAAELIGSDPMEEIGGGRGDGMEESGGSFLQGEDDWEGIERSEMEKMFGVATEFVSGAGEAVAMLSADVQMRLYALHKVATEGPCYEPQPLALNFGARAKWHAWQSLGNMNPDVAMEHYISLLSQCIPGWMEEKYGGDAKGNDPPAAGVIGTGRPDIDTSFDSQPSSKIRSETKEYSDDGNSSVGSELCRQGLANTLFLKLLSPTSVRFLCFYL